MTRVLLGLLGLVAALLAAALLLQRRLLYFPARGEEANEVARAVRLGLTAWRDGTGRLLGWRIAPPGRPLARLLVLHGNAGSALDRAYYAAALVPRGLEVVLLEYPGYGARPGSPSAEALTTAAVEAVDALAAEGAPVWILGESLGSGMAGRAAGARPAAVSALLLVTPFADLAAVARHHYPFVPAALLLDRTRPALDLAAWPGRAAVLAAGRDEVTTLGQAQALYEALPGPRRLWVQEQATHNGLDLGPGLPLWDELVAFLAGAASR